MRMLKLTALSVCAVLLLTLLALTPERLCFKSGTSYTFFCGDTSRNCREITVNTNAALKKLTLPDVCGECTEYETLDLESFLDSVNGEIVFCEELSDSVNYYCRAALPYSVYLYGSEINLHVCVKREGVKVASPIIFGGY